MSSVPPLRVLLVDDQPLIRTGLRTMLECEDDLIVCGRSGNSPGLRSIYSPGWGP